ncbi:MAG: helix-hairpin-helix domain-containing protein [Anaerovoracaceae bacterium]
MKSKKIKDFLNTDNIIKIFRDHKDIIKTAALPVVIGLAVLFFWFHGYDEEPQIKTDAEGTPSESSQYSEKLDDSAQGEEIYVDIDGAIKNPGVYKVSDGTRLFQVIELAGGLTENASTQSLNRAEAVYDGQKITIYSADTQNFEERTNDTKDGRVNINTADSITLQTIPGIGPSKAERIIDYRNTEGKFKKIEDIKNVTGIGDTTFENIKDYITV